jgi:asparagine synthase (glutamine-hydrolysing)
MADVLDHRGPDGRGEWNDSSVAFAHRRLAIIDLSETGHQPMTSDDGRLVVTFNGEIYNHRELSAELQRAGWNPRGSSDTEVLVAGVRHWGLDAFLARADGMWAFALYDRDERQVHLVRDRFGEKPLVHCAKDGVFWFASELRSIELIPSGDLKLDPYATADYFRFGHVPGTSTIFADVRRVPPASVITVAVGKVAGPPVRYWHVPMLDRSEPSPVIPRIGAAIKESVRRRLVSDRPIGAFLSGGINSSLACAYAACHVAGPLETFTIGWEDAEFDESRQAARVASALGANHHGIQVSRRDVIDVVRELPTIMDEPFADSSQLAVLLVTKEATKRVSVCLTGDGGDELFGGYNRHAWLLRLDTWHHPMPFPMRRALGAALQRSAPIFERVLSQLPHTFRPRLIADKTTKLRLALEAPSLMNAYQGLIANDPSIGTGKHLETTICDAVESRDRNWVLWGLRAADLTTFLSDNELAKVDRATMANGMESRTPFLSADLATLAFHLDASDLIAGGTGKQPLRHLLGEVLPGVSFNESKMGFGVPIADLLRSALAGDLAEAIISFEHRRSPIHIDWRALRHQLNSGDDTPQHRLWSLLMFELWASSRPGLEW